MSYVNELTFHVNRAKRIHEQRPIRPNRYSSKFMVKTVKHPGSVSGLGLLLCCWSWGPLLSTMNSEIYEKISGGPSHPLHVDSLPHPFSSGCDTLPCKQAHQEVFGGQGLWGHWLARQQCLFKSDWKLLELHEGETEGQEHRLHQEADQLGQWAVDHRHIQGLSQESQRLNAQENPECAGCEEGCYKLLIVWFKMIFTFLTVSNK